MTKSIIFSSSFDEVSIEDLIELKMQSEKRYLESIGCTDVVIKPLTPDQGKLYALDITSVPPPIAESVQLTPEMINYLNQSQ